MTNVEKKARKPRTVSPRQFDVMFDMMTGEMLGTVKGGARGATYISFDSVPTKLHPHVVFTSDDNETPFAYASKVGKDAQYKTFEQMIEERRANRPNNRATQAERNARILEDEQPVGEVVKTVEFDTNANGTPIPSSRRERRAETSTPLVVESAK